jgi:NADPH:quinone reductase-like Zn-dependent oxidoreductase
LKPANISHGTAAASATAALTALQAIRDCGKLGSAANGGDATAGQTHGTRKVLVTGVSGAVGSLGILVAQKLGAHVTAVGSGRGLDLARRLGAEAVVDRKQGDVIANAKGPFDVVLDAAAAYRWSQWKKDLKPHGAYVTTLPSAAFAADKIRSLFSSTSVGFVNCKSRGKDLELLAGWLAEGGEVTIDSTFPIRDLAKGFAHYKKGDYLGRIVVEVEGGF